MVAEAADRSKTLTLVLGYCGLRFGETVARRRRHVGDRVLTVRSSVTDEGIVEDQDEAGSSCAGAQICLDEAPS